MLKTDISAFVGWGGPVWVEQVERGLQWLGDLAGRRVLEIGTRSGGMATLLAMRGASVTALDVTREGFESGRAAAATHNVGNLITFDVYSGKPEDLPTGYDVIFSKSTLVLMQDIEDAARAIANALVPGGRLLAIENARGPLPMHVARIVRRRSLHPHGASYFTNRSVSTIREFLDVDLIRWTAAPPTVVIGAVKRGES